MNGIEIKNTSKDFGNVHALKDVSVHFEENKIYGLLGRNGAGKSTLLNVITGRIFASNGEEEQGCSDRSGSFRCLTISIKGINVYT